ncbi:MAG TPA: type II toxin-antitoxin system RelE/ParE family toxin [Dehalococcoidia bacterium]|nr:type II toxin-antitoxin system RelE/ParE family toxin [Dehalococcoidia bacterium]
MATREVEFTRGFTRLFRRLPDEVRQATYQKLALFAENPAHPSLRVKRVKGTPGVWEMSITMNYRVTFEVDEERVILRAIGTHDVLRRP